MSLRETVPIRGGKTLLRQGEQPLQERVNPAEIANLVLAGSTVAAGRAVVYATGTQTEFGQVAHLTTEVKRETSTLEVQITRIVRIITAIAIGMGATVFLLGYFLIGLNITESFIFAIGIIVANVPEGLLPTVTLALALGVKQMARQNALVRRLSAVEIFSATTVICTDKTGTLTKNEMTVRYLWLPPDLASDPVTKNMLSDRIKKVREFLMETCLSISTMVITIIDRGVGHDSDSIVICWVLNLFGGSIDLG